MSELTPGLARALGSLGLGVVLLAAPAAGRAQLTHSQTVTGGITSGSTIVLPAWTPAPNDLVLVAVALRDETRSVTVSGNGLSFVEVANLDNAQGQTGVNLFRAMGASPTAGSITVSISGNSLPAVASATRISGASTSGTHGSGAIEAVATNAGPPVTDDDDMKINVTTLTSNAWAYAAGTHRLATFSVPAGETAVSINNVAGSDGDKTTLSTWYEAVATPGTLTLGADNDLNSARDWAVIAVSIKPADPAQGPVTVGAGIASGATIVLPAWSPGANELVLVAVALRDETKSVSVSGNGLTFVEIANLDNAQAQTGVNLFRAMGASPVAGSITVSISGNTLPAVASATRFAGVDGSGTNGSGAIEALAMSAGPPVTDDRNMKVEITTLSNNARAYAAGTHRLATFSVPAGETAISINNVAGTSGDMTTLSTWYEAVATPGTLTLGADNDLNSARDWALVAVSIKAAAAGNAAPTVSITSPVSGESFQAPASLLTVAATAQDADGSIASVEFFANGNLIGGATASPFTIQWVNVVAGDYALTARATDNLGAQTTSAAVNVTLRVPQLFFVHTDHLNTPRLIANGASQTVWTWAHDDPFGANAPNEDPSGLGIFTCNLRLPGQYFDKETNLHYNYFRDYEPGIGRYIQSDPIGILGQIRVNAEVAQFHNFYAGRADFATSDSRASQLRQLAFMSEDRTSETILYAYVGNNPLSVSDPTGNFAILGAFWGPIVQAFAWASGSVGAVAGSVATVNALQQRQANQNLGNLVQAQWSYCTKVNFTDPLCGTLQQTQQRWVQCTGATTAAGGQMPGLVSPNWPVNNTLNQLNQLR